MIVYPFVESPVNFKQVQLHPVYMYGEQAEKGEPEKLYDYLYKHIDYLREAKVRTGGWIIDLRPYLKCFWVKTRWNGIIELWAPYKKHIRKFCGYHNVIKIVEIEKE